MMKWTIVLGLACGLAACGDDTGTGSGAGGTGGGDSSTTSDSSTATGACGTPIACDAFCSLAAGTCASEYADAATCETECAGWAVGCVGDTSGNTRGCREYHLTAANADAATHCPHAGPSGGGVCVD